MKKSLAVLSNMIMMILLLSACTAQKPSKPPVSGSELLFMYKWNLVALNGNAVDTPSRAQLLFYPGQVSRVAGSTGCNRFTGNFELGENGRIKLSPMATTRMACPDNSLENPFLDAMQKVTDWRVVDGQLVLYAVDTVVARFSGVKDPDLASGLNGTWELNYIGAQGTPMEQLFPHQKPRLVFNLPSKEVTGNTSCNSFGIPFTIKDKTIRFGDGRVTLMACEGNGERVFLDALKKVNAYSVHGNTLNFIMGDIAIMRFERK